MRMIHKSHLPLLVGLLLVAGCSLVSVTILINLDVTGTHRSTSSETAFIAVDLTQDPDFRDNQDKIQSVDEVGFVFRAQNNIAVQARGEIWISRSAIVPATPTSIRFQARRILSGLVLPSGGYANITYEQSLAMEDPINKPYLHESVKQGRFYLYGIADTATFDLTIDQLTAVVVLTAGK
jgi:hypothetical protein